MNLVLDIGNSFSKIAVLSKNHTIEKLIQTALLEKQVIENTIREFSVQKGIISTVRNMDSDIMDFLKNSIPTFIHLMHQTPLPIENLYKTPETLGKDRIAAAVAGNFLYPKSNVLIIDAGTSLTYEFVNDKHQYLGGAISIGLQMRFKSLNQHTAHLPLVKPEKIPPLIGDSTEAAISSGVINGMIAEIEHTISHYQSLYPELKIILTGGDTNFLVNALKSNIFVDPHLVLKGLNIILEYNAG